MAAEGRKFLSQKVIRTLLIAFGLLIVLDYPVFNLIAYMDASREVIMRSSLEVWLSVSYGLVLFTARVLLFVRKAGMEEGGKLYKSGTWILQGLYAVLCILIVVILASVTKGQYAKPTVNDFIEFKEILAFLAISQGMIQRIFHNGCVLVGRLSKNHNETFEYYVLRIIFYLVILFEAHRISWYWCRKWIGMFLGIIGI